MEVGRRRQSAAEQAATPVLVYPTLQMQYEVASLDQVQAAAGQVVMVPIQVETPGSWGLSTRGGENSMKG